MLNEKATGAPNHKDVYLTKTSQETLFYWHVNQRPPCDINSSIGPHQRGSSIQKAIHWHVRNKWKRQSIGMWETNGLMNRIDIAKSRTIWKGRLGSTIALTEEWLQMSLSTSFFNGDVAQKVERLIRMREERWWMPRITNFSEKTGNQKTNYGKRFCQSKKNIDKYV